MGADLDGDLQEESLPGKFLNTYKWTISRIFLPSQELARKVSRFLSLLPLASANKC
jgi:hypothetical protein